MVICVIVASAELGVTHVAGLDKCFVESESIVERMGSVSVGSAGKIVTQERTIVRMCAILYDFMCTLYGRLASQVGDALVGDDDVYGVLRVVNV